MSQSDEEIIKDMSLVLLFAVTLMFSAMIWFYVTETLQMTSATPKVFALLIGIWFSLFFSSLGVYNFMVYIGNKRTD